MKANQNEMLVAAINCARDITFETATVDDYKKYYDTKDSEELSKFDEIVTGLRTKFSELRFTAVLMCIADSYPDMDSITNMRIEDVNSMIGFTKELVVDLESLKEQLTQILQEPKGEE